MSFGRFSLPALLLAVALPALAATPRVGQSAPDFTLSTVSGERISLSSLTSRGSVVLIVLRGYPGYQCPFSQMQFQSYAQAASTFAAVGAQVLFVYPGAGGHELAEDARNMTGNAALPANVHVVLDPDFQLTSQYGLRWDAPNQTAYPSTFLIGQNGTVIFAHTGRTSSDQTPAQDALAVLHANTDEGKD